MSDKNSVREYLAARREQLLEQTALREGGQRVAEELEIEDEDAFESTLAPSPGLIITSLVATLVLIAIVASTWYRLSPPRFSGVGIGVILGCGSLVFVGPILGSIWERLGARNAVRRWPSTEALIVSSEPRITGHSTQDPMTRPYAVCEYEAGGKLYSKGMWLDTTSSNMGMADSTCSDYPPGQSLPIRYHPTRPEWALAEGFGRLRSPRNSIILLVFCIGLIGFGVVSVLLLI